jgi:hypothetical protein
MAVQKLERNQWHPFFEHVSKILVGKRAEIEVAALDLGDQVEAEWLPVLGIVYDPKNDVLEIALDGVDHLIQKPQEIYIDIGEGVLANLEVIDGAGVNQIVQLRDPLMLPAPSGAS